MTDIIKREYVVPLRRGFLNTPRYYRTNKAVRVLKEFMKKHMKSDNIKIGPKLNDLIWVNGIKNPPCKVKVIATKDKEGLVRVELVGFEYKDFKQVETKEKPETLKEKIADKVTTAKGTPRNHDGDKVEEKTEVKETEVKKEIKEKPKEVTEKKPKEEKVEETKTEKPKVEEKPKEI